MEKGTKQYRFPGLGRKSFLYGVSHLDLDVVRLDDRLRGAVEHSIEDMLELSNKESFDEDVAWVFEAVPISSRKDFLLGFVIGRMTQEIWSMMIREKKENLQEAQEILKHWMPQIQSKIVMELNR